MGCCSSKNDYVIHPTMIQNVTSSKTPLLSSESNPIHFLNSPAPNSQNPPNPNPKPIAFEIPLDNLQNHRRSLPGLSISEQEIAKKISDAENAAVKDSSKPVLGKNSTLKNSANSLGLKQKLEEKEAAVERNKLREIEKQKDRREEKAKRREEARKRKLEMQQGGGQTGEKAALIDTSRESLSFE